MPRRSYWPMPAAICAAVLFPSCSHRNVSTIPAPMIVIPRLPAKQHAERSALVPEIRPSENRPSVVPPAPMQVKPMPFRKREAPAHENRKSIPTYDVAVQVDRESGRQRNDQQTAIAEQLATLDVSMLVFRCPEEMTIGSTQTVSAALTESVDNIFRRQLQSRGINPEKVSTAVEAVLSSNEANAFDIAAQDSGGGTGWAWRVKPKQVGRHTLTLKARFTAALAEKTYERAFPPLSQLVTVEADRATQATGVIRTSLLWIAPIGVFAVLLMLMRQRRSKLKATA